MKKDLKYFMQEANESEIIKVGGIERYKDEEGNIIPFEIKVLSQEEISNIINKYTDKRIALDKRGNPIVSNGEVVYKTVRNNEKASRHIIVEALLYPNLKDPELMGYYNCVDITDMPLKVFRTAEEYNRVSRVVMEALGMGSYGLDDDELVEQAKK